MVATFIIYWDGSVAYIILFNAFAFQPISPVRAEVDVKLGGTQCNIIMSRLKPWLRLQSSKKKGMFLQEETSTIMKPQSTESKAFMWTCTVSAPEMTIVLYSISDVPLYHVSNMLCLFYIWYLGNG